tara:strand:+ start:308 stop:556 length:249 start_codon:yes stop_codon:yes gene_type:complete
MVYYVYLLKTIKGKAKKTYVGYTNNLNKRLYNHNNNKGAKSTKGYKWKLIFKKKFLTKKAAMSYEYFLKNKRSLRKKIISLY